MYDIGVVGSAIVSEFSLHTNVKIYDVDPGKSNNHRRKKLILAQRWVLKKGD